MHTSYVYQHHNVHSGTVPHSARVLAIGRQTRRAYQNDLRTFMAFTGIIQPEEFRVITRGHILAWRADLEKQALAGATIRRKLAASAYFMTTCVRPMQ